MTSIHTILFPTDFSDDAQAAFALAAALARDYGATLIVLHVATPPPFVSYGELQLALQSPDGYRRQLEDELRRYEGADPRTRVVHRLENGDPAAEILRVARETGSDLIVIGTHGRTGLGRLLMGSVAENVLRKAPCPVLTVKLPPSATPALAGAGAGQAAGSSGA